MNADEPAKQIKILLVEDDELIRELLASKLQKNSFETIIAQDGTAVEALAHQERPDIIALDIVMPEMNGYEVLDMLRQDAELCKIPVVVLSNLGQDYEIQKCKDMGALDFIIKANCTPGEMVTRLREIYEKTKAAA